jgi:inner membrane protein
MNLIQKLKTSVTLRLLGILFIVLLLLIPLGKVESLIHEREQLSEDVKREIHHQWGNPQIITGPILSVPYVLITNPETEKEERIKKFLHILPEKLSYSGNLESQLRKRGIYQAILYGSQLQMEGRFAALEEDLPVDEDELLWEEAEISFGLSDLRGIQNQVVLNLDGKTFPIQPGIQNGPPLGEGFHFELKGHTPGAFRMQFDLNGSESIYFTPLGKHTNVAISSNWPSPSFQGDFLPESHDISEAGFTANWSVLDINRSYGQVWKDKLPPVQSSRFGFFLDEGVNAYHKTLRAVKYGFMIISLVFTVFFFFELLKKLRMHPAQYTIVGISVVVFYTLVVALSEHMQFGFAYILSAFGILLINSLYFYSIVRHLLQTALFTLVFSLVLSFIYVLLNLEEYALLVGSLGLFLITGLVMYLTRNVDWYDPGDKTDAQTLVES